MIDRIALAQAMMNSGNVMFRKPFAVMGTGAGVGVVGSTVLIKTVMDRDDRPAPRPYDYVMGGYMGGMLGVLGGMMVGLIGGPAVGSIGKRMYISSLVRMSERVQQNIPPGMEQLGAETAELFTRNANRMRYGNQSVPGGGYRDYPDYAEVAQARANFQFLRDVARGS